LVELLPYRYKVPRRLILPELTKGFQ
jgi:hypothetical protein